MKLTPDYIKNILNDSTISEERIENIIKSSYLLAELVVEKWIREHKRPVKDSRDI